jgi:hypothetical protein
VAFFLGGGGIIGTEHSDYIIRINSTLISFRNFILLFVPYNFILSAHYVKVMYPFFLIRLKKGRTQSESGRRVFWKKSVTSVLSKRC